MWAMPVLSLTLGLALGIPTIYEIWRLMFHTPRSGVSIVSLDIKVDDLLLHAINLGDNPGVIDNRFSCDEDYEGTGRLSLTVFGPKVVVVFPMAETKQNWNVWNADVAGADSGDPTEDESEQVAIRLIEAFPDSKPTSDEKEVLTHSLSQQGSYAPMYDVFRYYLVLAGHLELLSERELPDEFTFSCRLDVTDGTGNPYREAFELSFGPGSLGINPKLDPTRTSDTGP